MWNAKPQMNFNPTKSQEYIFKTKQQQKSRFKNVDYIQAMILGKEGPQECATARSGGWVLEPDNVTLHFCTQHAMRLEGPWT